ncbi:hypothetical protein H4P12_16595 [Paracoccus sp. 11-3]|uniref:DUF4123 domain-containing protein n=1 Tax=Paracoccus amoyensis TaxID=2760093 RepID=A0A926JDL9_9RHOB|nr:hypothetical protein [Paracoccus amoyensis]MBC9248290.1 hypothetical protein [Paracoccus amoyensis]
MQQDDPWSLGAANKPAHDEPKTEAQAPGSLEEALLAMDHQSAPVFAVLDGAQFDNLPQELMMGDFVSRPLYLDRGDNNPEQIITAPHMVWLDERPEKITGRQPQETIPALMTLIANRPAAVFWQCPAGAEALYKHLRGINVVLYPKAALPDYEEPQPAETDEIRRLEKPDTHTLVLFRHADANVLAQTLAAMSALEVARFYGPATSLIFAPVSDWANGQTWWRTDRPEDLPDPHRGHLRISMETVGRTEGIRIQHNRRRITAYLRRVAPDQTRSLDDATLDAMAGRYMSEAHAYGVRSEAAMGRWCFLQVVAGGRMSSQKEIADYVAVPDGRKTADERVRDLMAMVAFRASRR